MFFQTKNWLKAILPIMFAALQFVPHAHASLTDYVEESKSYTIRSLPSDPKERKSAIKTIFSQPTVSMFDLSGSDVSDNDLKYLFKGLVQRELKSQKASKSISIKLLDLTSRNITSTGIENLLKYFQQGETVKKEKIHPDVREMIIKVSPQQIDVTAELLSRWHRIAPSVFAGGLTIVE